MGIATQFDAVAVHYRAVLLCRTVERGGRIPETSCLALQQSHINPAGLCLYGSPAHTSVMRVNKRLAKGQLSPQNERGHKGRGGCWECEQSGPRRCSDRCQGFKQGVMYETTAPKPEMIINREQGRECERKGCIVFICQICYFPGSDTDSEPVKNEKRSHPGLIGGD